jgi:HlyD family secretion protein
MIVWHSRRNKVRKNHVLLGLSLLAIVGLLTGCGPAATETVPADAVPIVAQAEDTVVAEGLVEPARWSELRFDAGGRVIEVLVDAGDAVAESDLLLRIDPTDEELAVLRAQAALALAEAQLSQAQAGARPEEIAVTEAQLEAAEAALAEAAAHRGRLAGGEAEADVAAAQAALAGALAEQKQTENLHERTLECFTFKWSGERRTICPALGRPEEYARYAWETAGDNLSAAEMQLAATQNQAQARVRDADAGVWAAAAQRDALQARLELQQAGSQAERIAAAEAEVTQAEAALAAAEAALERTAIRAPFDGVVAEVSVEVGDTATAGQVLVVVATLDQLWVRTEDLTELDVVHVVVGQSVVVTLDALPDQSLAGRVARVDRQSEDYRGDVTYPVFVTLDEGVDQMRWGMTALVEIDVR